MRKFLRIAQIGFFSLDAATNFIKGLLLAFAIHKWIRVRISISLCHFWRRQNWSWTSMSWGHLKGGVETPNNENRNSSLGSTTPTFLLLKIGTHYQHCFPGCDCSVWKWIDRFVKVLLILWIKVHRCKLGRAICNLQCQLCNVCETQYLMFWGTTRSFSFKSGNTTKLSVASRLFQDLSGRRS